MNEQTMACCLLTSLSGAAVDLTQPEIDPTQIRISAQITEVLRSTNARLYSASIKQSIVDGILRVAHPPGDRSRGPRPTAEVVQN